MNQPNQDEAEVRSRLERLPESVARNLETAHPTELTGMTFGQETSLGLFVGCRGLFVGIQPLIRMGLADEARILLRTLLADTIRVQYFRRNAPRLEELAVRFVRDSLFEERRLACEARGIEYTWPDQVLDEINDQIEAYTRPRASSGSESVGCPSFARCSRRSVSPTFTTRT
jgi:hypothetical protein